MHLTETERQQFRSEPTPEVIDAAWKTIRAHESAIDSLEERARGFLSQVQQLRYEQGKHRAVIERSKGLLTLARRLPEELLIKIFGHCIEDGWTRAPIALSHVCSAWRRASHAPQVWSHVYVQCDDANVFERTQFWLAMAREAGLHVIVVASRGVSLRSLHRLMALLVAHSGQWRSLQVDTDLLRHADVIIGRCKNPLPELRRIDIRTPALDSGDPEGASDLPRLAAAFDAEGAPKLTTINYISSVIPAVPIFPTHIRSLTIDVQDSPIHRPFSAALVIQALEHLSELHTLTVSMPLAYEQAYVPEPDPSRTISLPNLSTLTLSGPTDLNEFLPHLVTPSLRRLHLRSLEDVGYRQQPIGPSFTRFLEQSAPPLELLDLHDIDLTPDTFAACFAALPDLRELRLHESSISDATVRLLEGPRRLCPRLVRLDLRWCGMLRGRALVDLVKSRCSTPDTALTVTGPAPVPIEEVAAINCCFVLEGDVLDLARMTTCRIVVRDGNDYCRTRGCCENLRYRARLHMKHFTDIRDGEVRIIL